jgi:hypothetical protein
MSTYPLRIADHVMEEAKRAAAEDNVSLNQLLSAFIADGIGHRRAIMNLKKAGGPWKYRCGAGHPGSRPDVDPDPGDELVEGQRASSFRP